MTRTDIAVTTSLGASLDATGRMRDTTDAETLEPIVQRAMLRAMNTTVPWYGDAITPAGAEAYRAAVEQGLRDDDVVDASVRVRLGTIERNTLSLRVRIGDRIIELDDTLTPDT